MSDSLELTPDEIRATLSSFGRIELEDFERLAHYALAQAERLDALEAENAVLHPIWEAVAKYLMVGVVNSTLAPRHTANCICSLKTWATEKDCDCGLAELRRAVDAARAKMGERDMETTEEDTLVEPDGPLRVPPLSTEKFWMLDEKTYSELYTRIATLEAENADIRFRYEETNRRMQGMLEVHARERRPADSMRSGEGVEESL